MCRLWSSFLALINFQALINFLKVIFIVASIINVPNDPHWPLHPNLHPPTPRLWSLFQIFLNAPYHTSPQCTDTSLPDLSQPRDPGLQKSKCPPQDGGEASCIWIEALSSRFPQTERLLQQREQVSLRARKGVGRATRPSQQCLLAPEQGACQAKSSPQELHRQAHSRSSLQGTLLCVCTISCPSEGLRRTGTPRGLGFVVQHGIRGKTFPNCFCVTWQWIIGGEEWENTGSSWRMGLPALHLENQTDGQVEELIRKQFCNRVLD